MLLALFYCTSKFTYLIMASYISKARPDFSIVIVLVSFSLIPLVPLPMLGSLRMISYGFTKISFHCAYYMTLHSLNCIHLGPTNLRLDNTFPNGSTNWRQQLVNHATLGELWRYLGALFHMQVDAFPQQFTRKRSDYSSQYI